MLEASISCSCLVQLRCLSWDRSWSARDPLAPGSDGNSFWRSCTWVEPGTRSWRQITAPVLSYLGSRCNNLWSDSKPLSDDFASSTQSSLFDPIESSFRNRTSPDLPLFYLDWSEGWLCPWSAEVYLKVIRCCREGKVRSSLGTEIIPLCELDWWSIRLHQAGELIILP